VNASVLLLLMGCSALSGCLPRQLDAIGQHKTVTLQETDLEQYGLAFLTPSTVTGQEQDIQALALVFDDVLAHMRPRIRQVDLSQTLGAVNQNGYAEDYKQMFRDYRDTGIFRRDLLQKIGQLTGCRYLGQLKLASFTQETRDRFGLFGLRLVSTQHAKIRVFLQIWDSREGTIAWEGTEEVSSAVDTPTEAPVTFKAIAADTAQRLIARLP
jgi:hypothetical protein